jgi:RNA polymerase sigma factor (sigma-70 family)
MACSLSDFLRCHRRIAAVQELAHLADAQLLQRYVRGRDEAAFAVLVYRHGGMVLGLCRRLVHNPADADDAFQATWITLARKAGVIRRPQAVASWLYKVAFRAAAEIRARAGACSRPVAALEHLPDRTPQSDSLGCEERQALEEEVARLPEKYRSAIVLCYLEGKTVLQAARELGCARGTILSRLARRVTDCVAA